MLIAMILMGLLAYLIYSLKIIYSIAWSLEEVVTELVVPMVLICVILNIAISIFWGSGLLLSDTNIDSVLALPIPLRTLILSKLTVLFMVEVALTVALLLPMMVLFGLTAGMGFPFYLIVLGITILFPVIPGLLGTMFGTQIYRILKNSSARIARLKAAAAILILFAFMIFMFCKFPDIAAGNFGDVISTSTFTLYAGQYIHRLLNGDYLLIGIYFGGVFLIGVTLLYGLIKIFRNWYNNDAIQGSKSQPVDWNKQTTKQHSPVSALLERERTRYFSLPVYLTNTACGLLFAAVFVLLVVLMSDKITPYIYQLAEYFQVPFADYDVLFIYAFSILTTISCTTYVSISIEGKQIEILKSLPIAAKCLFRVKLLHHLSMSVPTIFVLNTIMALYLQWSFPKAMLGYAFPLLCSVLIGMIGYILNLIFPNFECHPYYQAKSTSNFDGLDRSCSYLWNGISAVEIFPKRLVYGELACLCNYSIAAFNNGGVGGQKRSALISRIIERYLFIAKRCKVMIQKWILCPVCGSKTRVRIREDTVLENFPLYCPKCKHETLISARQLNISVIKEPDAQTQSR